MGHTSTAGMKISPTPPLIFTGEGVKKCDIWHRFQHHSTLNCPRLKMQQYIRTVKQTSCVVMNDHRAIVTPSLVKLALHTPENRWAEMPPPKKNCKAKTC